MRLSAKQIVVCIGIGIVLAILSGTPGGEHSLESVIPYLIGKALGSSLLCMVFGMVFNLISQRRASQNGAAPKP
ncbi:MAG: hypothetical protein WA374_06060 [Acidobacteriaceae bacterium]